LAGSPAAGFVVGPDLVGLPIPAWKRGRADPVIFEIEGDLFFYILAAASFVEITSDLYTANLTAHFRGDEAMTDWLETVWAGEEVGHGRRLKAHIEATAPEFDWDGAYGRFMAEFRPHCTEAALAPSRAEELVALCVVETGTASLYRMLADAAPTMDLQRLAARISGEEIGHYKHFLRHYRLYRERQGLSLGRILTAFHAQATAIESIDAQLAFKHVYLTRHPGRTDDALAYAAFRQACRRLARRHFPHRMAIRMLVILLPWPAVLRRALIWPLTALGRLMLLR